MPRSLQLTEMFLSVFTIQLPNNLTLQYNKNNVYNEMMLLPERERNRIFWMGSGHGDERSVAFPGIAKAMAEQWGEYVLHKL